jgi:hypothetical protein
MRGVFLYEVSRRVLQRVVIAKRQSQGAKASGKAKAAKPRAKAKGKAKGQSQGGKAKGKGKRQSQGPRRIILHKMIIFRKGFFKALLAFQ